MKKLLLIALVLPFLTACGFEIVDTGHRGVKTEFGKVTGESLPEGLYFYNPFSTDITELDVRTQNLEFKASSYSLDAQVVDVTISANLNLQPTAAHTVYETVGTDWATKIVYPILVGLTKETVGQYKAVDLISDRNNVTMKIKEALATKLLEKNVMLTNLEISSLDFDNQFEEAVRNKVIAVENAKEAQNKTVRIKEEAAQKVIAAKAEAESMRIRANALTQNKALVEYEAVQKWDGKMPQIIMGGGATPFVNLNNLTSGR